MDSSVMYLERWTIHSSFCSSRTAPMRRTTALVRFAAQVIGEDADDIAAAFDLAIEAFERIGAV
jgi:predicted ATPase